ncbi:MAG: hypothetical protein EB072_04210 [Betaproteobacteria bacterium]|nr:hypothetical protein [Betaproteobacteria bacterium]
MLDSYNKRLQEYEAIYLKPERQADLGTLMLGLLKMLPMRCSDGGRSQLDPKSLAEFLDRFKARVGLGS